MKRVTVVLCLACFLVGLMAFATSQARPAAPFATTQGFSGDVTGVQDGRPTSGKIYFMGEKFRMEQKLENELIIFIMDRNKKTVWLLNPADKTYVELDLNTPGVTDSMPFPDETGKPCASLQATSCTRMGQETVNGRQCERWELTSTSDGDTIKTTVWLDPTLRAPIRWQTDAGERYDFTKIQVGAQPDSLFQVPAGYKKASR